jgi:hypothetical protein
MGIEPAGDRNSMTVQIIIEVNADVVGSRVVGEKLPNGGFSIWVSDLTSFGKRAR